MPAGTVMPKAHKQKPHPLQTNATNHKHSSNCGQYKLQPLCHPTQHASCCRFSSSKGHACSEATASTEAQQAQHLPNPCCAQQQRNGCSASAASQSCLLSLVLQAPTAAPGSVWGVTAPPAPPPRRVPAAAKSRQPEAKLVSKVWKAERNRLS